MKKVLFAMAIAGMFGFAACKNNKTEEPVVEEPAMEAVEEATDETVENAVEEIIDSTMSSIAEVAAE